MTAPVFVRATGNSTAFTDTITFAFDAGSGTDRCLLATVWTYASSTSGIVGVTFNGVAMTPAAAQFADSSFGAQFRAFYLFGDANVAAGSHNIVATSSGGTQTHGQIGVALFTGVGGVSGGTNNTANSQSPSFTITSAVGDLAVAMMDRTDSAHTLTGTSGTSIDADSDYGLGVTKFCVLEKAGAASVTLTATISLSGDSWWGTGVSLAAVATGATAITASGPGNGTINAASSNFTFGVDTTPITGTVVVTPASDKAGTWQAPGTVSLTTGSPTGTLTFTPTVSGVHTITTTNDGGLTNSTPLSFSVASAYAPFNFPSTQQSTLAQ